MIDKLMNKEEANAALVLALSGALMVLVAKGDGSLSRKRLLSAVLSTPVPKGAAGTRGDASVSDPSQQIAA